MVVFIIGLDDLSCFQPNYFSDSVQRGAQENKGSRAAHHSAGIHRVPSQPLWAVGPRRPLGSLGHILALPV